MNKLFKIVLVILFTSCSLYAQWVRTNGPNSQFIYSLHLRGNGIYAGTSDGIYRSTNNGLAWVLVNNGLYTGNIRVTSVIDLYDKLFIGTDSGVYVSTNNGDLWIQKNSGLNTVNSRLINSLFIYNSLLIFAGTESGIYVSSDEGESWSPKNNGLNILKVYSFTSRANKIFAGSESIVYISTNMGENWSISSLGLPTQYSVQTLATNGVNVVAGLCCGSGAYVTTDDGGRWDNIIQISIPNTFVRCDDKIFGGTADGVLLSTDGGYYWVAYNEGLQYLNTTAIDYNSTYIYAAVENYVWRRPIGEITEVQTSSSKIPDEFRLYQNYPNPFNPETFISYDLPLPAYVVLKVYNITGKFICSLMNRNQIAGYHMVRWDASNYPSGVYFYKLAAGSFSGTGKMVLIK
jgi:photosystem II stability/assembly factor-like uncharacterized protein